MEKIIIENYIGKELYASEPAKVLTYYHQQYPCSNVLTLLYLKMLEENRPKEYEKLKPALLLSLYNRNKFRQFKLSGPSITIDRPKFEEKKTEVAEKPVKEETTAITPESKESSDKSEVSVIDEVKKIMSKPASNVNVHTPTSIEEEMGTEKTFEAPTINLEEDQSVVIDSLIAKFGGNPSTIKKSSPILEPLANYSEGSLVEDEEIISETLAIIYAEQGYSGKATKMLQKLCLIFPEKSSTFAGHIEMIKNGKYYNQIN